MSQTPERTSGANMLGLAQPIVADSRFGNDISILMRASPDRSGWLNIFPTEGSLLLVRREDHPSQLPLVLPDANGAKCELPNGGYYVEFFVDSTTNKEVGQRINLLPRVIPENEEDLRMVLAQLDPEKRKKLVDQIPYCRIDPIGRKLEWVAKITPNNPLFTMTEHGVNISGDRGLPETLSNLKFGGGFSDSRCANLFVVKVSGVVDPDRGAISAYVEAGLGLGRRVGDGISTYIREVWANVGNLTRERIDEYELREAIDPYVKVKLTYQTP